MDIFKDIQGEVEFFFDDLNWTYILIYVFILYGIKHKEEFQWFNDIFDKTKRLKSFKVWIAGLIVIVLFVLFKGLESGLEVSYISQILRSWIIVIVFNSIFSKKISQIDK